MTEQTNALSSVLSGYFLQTTDTFFMTFEGDVISYVNNAAAKLLGVPAENLIGKNDLSFVAQDEKDALKKRISEITGRSDYFIVHMTTASGEVLEMKCRLLPVILNDKKTIMLEGTNETLLFALKKKSEALENKLSHVSPVDLDTRLPTLILLDDRIDQAVLRTLREARGNIEDLQSFLMVMAVRIDGLSQIEEQFGLEGRHYIQDVLISRFKSSIRTVDSLAKDPDGYFYFLFEGIREKANVKLIVDRLKNCLTVPVLYKEKSIKFSINFGTSLYPEDGTSAVALIKAAKVNLMAALKS